MQFRKLSICLFKCAFGFRMTFHRIRILLGSLIAFLLRLSRLFLCTLISIVGICGAFIFCRFNMKSLNAFFFCSNALLHLLQLSMKLLKICRMTLLIHTIFCKHCRIIFGKHFRFRCIFQFIKQFQMLIQLFVELLYLFINFSYKFRNPPFFPLL